MLENKVICIIGGNGLIGNNFAKACLKLNCNLIIADKLINNNRNLKNNNRLNYIDLDIKSESSISNLIKKIHRKFKKIDAFVNCAYPRSKKFGTKFKNLDPKYLKEDLFNQLGSPIILSKLVISYFEKQGFGNLIHISSIQGIAAPKFKHYYGTKMDSPIEYSAAKAGIISITKYLAKYCKGKNIRVNCISPGGIKDKQPTKFLKKYKDDCLSKGMLDPEDLNGTIIFLLSDMSKFINGQNIIIDDGWTL